jgi:hypothetical protein
MSARLEQPSWSSEAIVDAVRRLVSDFDDRATNTVTGTGTGGVRPGDRVLLVDDLTSTGGTLVALARAVALAGGEVIEVLTIGEKTENGGRAFVAEALGLAIKTIVETDLVDRGTGPRSRVRHVNLGHLTRPCFESVARNFPPGFCRLGSGADVALCVVAQPA